MSILWPVIIGLAILEGIITTIAIKYDPAALPDSLVYAGLIAGSLLATLSLVAYVAGKVHKDWRLSLIQFFLLYFCLIVGFASGYYLKKNEFV